MTKLEKLYSIIENSKDVGVTLPEEVIRQVEEMEEDIIKDEILPALSEDIAPRLEPIRRELVLVVEYHPGEPISVALSRKAKISEIVDAKPLTPSVSKPVTSEEKSIKTESHEPIKHIENPTKGLRVTFPDGTIIWHAAAIDTYVEALQKIGFSRVAHLDMKHAGYNIVSKTQRPAEAGKVWQHECDGWYIYSNISNETKIADLKAISDRFQLHLTIEELKPSK